MKGSFCDDHESYTDPELRDAAEAWINVEEADDVCDARSGLHMDRLLAPKTDEEQASTGSMQPQMQALTAVLRRALPGPGVLTLPKVPKT